MSMPSIVQGASQSFFGQEDMLSAIRETAAASANDEGGSTPVMDEEDGLAATPTGSDSRARHKENAVDFLTSIMTSNSISHSKQPSSIDVVRSSGSSSSTDASWTNWKANESGNPLHFIPAPPQPPFAPSMPPTSNTNQHEFPHPNFGQESHNAAPPPHMQFRGPPPFPGNMRVRTPNLESRPPMSSNTSQPPRPRGMRHQFNSNEFTAIDAQSNTSPNASAPFPRFPPPPRPPSDLFFSNNQSDVPRMMTHGSPPGFPPDQAAPHTFPNNNMRPNNLGNNRSEWQHAPGGGNNNYNSQSGQNPPQDNNSQRQRSASFGEGSGDASALQLGDAQQEFNDKLKRKSMSNEARPTFERQTSSNLRTLTQVPVNMQGSMQRSPMGGGGFPAENAMRHRFAMRHQNFRQVGPYRQNFRPRNDYPNARANFRGAPPRMEGQHGGPPPLIRHDRPF